MNKDTTLLLIDLQERLMTAMPQEELAQVLRTAHILLELAQEVGATIIYTEQYPKGLGPTEAGLREALVAAGARRVEKMTFDACTAPAFHPHLITLSRQVVVMGMEAHICVLSTVRELIAHRHVVTVPFDGVISRDPAYRDNGLELMRAAGATVANRETLVFDALTSAEHPAFKRFSQMIR